MSKYGQNLYTTLIIKKTVKVKVCAIEQISRKKKKK